MNHIRGLSQRTKTKIYKNAFTLIEIMISMALLSVISSCFVYKGWDLLCEHRFLSSVRRVQAEVYSAKLNALTYQIDITLKLTEEVGKSVLFIEASNVPKALSSVMNKKIGLPNLKLQKEIIFYSNGYTYPDQALILSPFKGKTKARSIELSLIDRMKVV